MSQIVVRMATLDDAAAITEVHKSNISRWQRMTGDAVEDVPYEVLTIHERWLHGGPWMSLETCAVHLTHLLRGGSIPAGIPLVAEIDGRVWAEAEVFPGEEPEPFGNLLHVAVLYVHADQAGRGLEQALLAHAAALGKELGCQRMTIANVEVQDFSPERWRLLVQAQRVTWPARTGQVFYQSTPHPDADPGQIQAWGMPLGRGQSALQEWVMHWPDLWVGILAQRAQRVERLKFTAAASNFYVMYTESPYDSRQAAVSVWAAAPLSGPALAAISDRGHKLGFRRLETLIRPEQAGLLGPEAEVEGVMREIYALDL
jgi:GNAT superfamily N-acetyltransferase